MQHPGDNDTGASEAGESARTTLGRWAAPAIAAAWASLALAIIWICPQGLTGIEAYYWDWSRHPAWGYWSKPPMIAFVDWAAVHLLGNSESALRTPAILFCALSLACGAVLLRNISAAKRAEPLFVAGAIAMSASWGWWCQAKTDAPHGFFWLLAICFFRTAIRSDGGALSWAGVGIALGMALLTRYTAMFLLLSFAIYLVCFERKRLCSFGPWLAVFLALACLAGTVYWNHQNDWISFRHTAALSQAAPPVAGNGFHALGEIGKRFALYTGSQWQSLNVFLAPLLVAAVVEAIRRFRTNRDLALLMCCSLPIAAFYFVLSLFRTGYPHWGFCGYLTFPLLFVHWWRLHPRPFYMRFILGLALITGTIHGFAAPWLLADSGGPSLGKQADAFAAQADAAAFFSDSERYAAWAAFYSADRPEVCGMPCGQPQNQYDLWSRWPRLEGRTVLFITAGRQTDCENKCKALVEQGLFGGWKYLGSGEAKRFPATVESFSFAELKGFAGVGNCP